MAKTLPLALDDKHAAGLKELAEMQGMSESAVLRQALRMYQMIVRRVRDGEELAFTRNGVVIRQEIVGLPSFED